MRNRLTLADLAKVLRAQEALKAASETALVRAMADERERSAEVNDAEHAMHAALEDWRRALRTDTIDVSLVQLHAQGPIRRDAELSAARTRLEGATRRTATQTQHHARSIAQVRGTTQLRKNLAKVVARKAEERASTALEQRISRTRAQ